MAKSSISRNNWSFKNKDDALAGLAPLKERQPMD